MALRFIHIRSNSWTALASSRDGIAVPGFGSHQLLVFELAYLANPKKTKSVVVSRSHTGAPAYGHLSLGGGELEEVKSLRILWVTLDSKLTFETHMRETVPKVARSLAVVRRVGNLFDCPRGLIRAVSIHMTCPAWSIVLPWGCRLRSLILVCWIVLIAMRKGFVRVNVVVWNTEG